MSLSKNKTLFKKGDIPWNNGKGTIIVQCKTCDKAFSLRRNGRLSGRGKFCSMVCRGNYKYRAAENFKITPNMAELIGVIIGDGCIDNSWSNKGCYRIFISGNPIEDKPYMEHYLPQLIKKRLKKELKPFMGSNGAYLLQFSCEPFRLFLEKLGIGPNKTKIVKIPQEIKDKNILLRRCIRGIADTDFTVIGANHGKKKNVYPRIESQFASEALVRDLEESLRKMGFTLNTMYNRLNKDKRGHTWISSSINLEGPHNLNRWLKKIDFANLRLITRYQYLQKFGYLPPKTTLPQRLEDLKNG